MQQRLTIITLGVADLQASTNFYTQKLGWQKKGDYEDIVFIPLNGIMLGLYPKDKLAEDANLPPAKVGYSNITLAYNARSIEEVDALFQTFKEKEINIVKPPKKAFWGGYSGYIADPDGYLWEIAFNPYMELDEKGNVVS